MQKHHKIFFKHIEIAGCEIKNRFFMAPMGCFGLVDNEGILTDEGVEYYVERARGGMGLIITGICIVENEFEKINPIVLFCTKKTDPFRYMQKMKRLTDRVHAYGCKIFLQLSSGFGRAAMIPMIAANAVAPSVVENKWDSNIIHRELTTAEVEQYIASFGRAAEMAQHCGFDGVEIHAVHEGYLLDQFSTEIFNQRTDRFGGSFENRYRFAAEIVQTIKKACGNSFPVSLRYTPKHYMKGIRQGAVPGESFVELGRDMPEGIEAAKLLVTSGYDSLNVDLGCYDSHYWSHPPVYHKDGLYLDAAAQLKDAVDVPVMVAGRMDDPEYGAKALLEARCDMIGLGRPSLADPCIPNKIRTGHSDRIRHCISCNYGCSQRVSLAGKIGCAVNPQCANELYGKIVPAQKKKKVVIVGGGPAGAECARVCALRGHEVILFEKGNRIGGQLLPAAKAGFKKYTLKLCDWYANELELLGVDVQLNTSADMESILKEKTDTVVMAVGAKPVVPEIPGIANKNTCLATEVLDDISKAKQNIVILGAGQVGVETAILLLQEGRHVTIVEIEDTFMATGHGSDIEMAHDLISYYGGHVLLRTEVLEIVDSGVRIKNDQGERFMEADTVIVATGYVADDALYKELEEELESIYNIGDSAGVRNIYYAVNEGFELATAI